MSEMTSSHRVLAALLALTLALSACVPDPANRPTPSPTTAAPSLPATPSPVPTPSGPTPIPSFVRPTPTPLPTFLAYVVVAGDTLTSIARRHATTARSIAYWNRATYPTLDPDSESYDPNDIRIGWVLLLIPNAEVDPEEPPPTPTPTPTPAPSTHPSPSPTTGATGPSRVVSHGSRTKPVVALTLDMGGRLDPALAIMDWLIEHRVSATIFPTGKSASTTIGRQVLAKIRAHPDLFDVGNHSWDHPSFVDLTAAQMHDQLVRTEQVILDGTGMSSKPWFRPPFGSRNQAVLSGVGAAGWADTVMWDVDTIDWRPTSDGGPTAAQIVDKVVSKGQNGSIVLMHLGGWHTLEALPGIVDGLTARGLLPVTLGEMFGR
jgi:peptidoglycan/xylan/chitin deacetylase (PgdA/CDA1 family)